MVVAVLFTAGDQEPVIPFVDVEGKLILPPTQIGEIGSNVGVMLLLVELIVTRIVSVQLIDEETTQ